MAAGISFALAGLILQLGLLIALLRYRLYDAEVVIGRSVNFAVITLGVAAIFAAAGDALKQIVYNYSGNTQQRRSDHLRGRARDDHGQPDSGASPALV